MYLIWPSMFLCCHVYFRGLHNIVSDVTTFSEGSSFCCLIIPEIAYKTKDAKYGYDCVRYMVQQQPYSFSMWNCYYQVVSRWAQNIWFLLFFLFKFLSGIVKSRDSCACFDWAGKTCCFEFGRGGAQIQTSSCVGVPTNIINILIEQVVWVL